MVVRPRCGTIRDWIIEERQASKMYQRYGFKSQAKDELKHSRHFAKELQKCRSNK